MEETIKKQKINPQLERMIAQSIPVSKAEFNAAVNNADNVPETYFSNSSNNANRRCQMWWHPSGCLLCLQKGKYFIVPGTYKYINLISDPE